MNCSILGHQAIGLFIVFSTEALAKEVHGLSKLKQGGVLGKWGLG